MFFLFKSEKAELKIESVSEGTGNYLHLKTKNSRYAKTNDLLFFW
jgi:hypothetical protein